MTVQARLPLLSCAGSGAQYAYGITNIEYTEFKRLGIRDEAQAEGSHLSVFPANTNVLYLGLKVHPWLPEALLVLRIVLGCQNGHCTQHWHGPAIF